MLLQQGTLHKAVGTQMMEGLSQSGGITEDFTEEVTYCCVLKPKKKGRHDPGRGNSMYRRKEA